MAKQTLGRNLETLLQPRAPAGSGVRSLMRETQPEAAPPAKPVIPRWYLFGGDLLLASLAIIILYTSPHPLSWKKELFCGAVLALGGCLALAALFQPDASCAGAGVTPK